MPASTTPLPRLIASLLRLAAADAHDAALLARQGSARNAALLLRSATARVIAAVASAERGRPAPPDTRRIAAENPVKEALEALDQQPVPATELLPGGLIPEPPAPEQVLAGIKQLDAVLQRLLAHFEVTLESDAAAGSAQPLRPPPAPKPPRRPPPRRSTAPTPAEEPTAAPAKPPAGLASKDFWALVDHWGLEDRAALALIGHAGGLTAKGTRPRFKLTADEAAVILQMRALDQALAVLGLAPRDWLAKPIAAAPFGGATPAALILRRRLEGLRDTARYVTQLSLRVSLERS